MIIKERETLVNKLLKISSGENILTRSQTAFLKCRNFLCTLPFNLYEEECIDLKANGAGYTILWLNKPYRVSVLADGSLEASVLVSEKDTKTKKYAHSSPTIEVINWLYSIPYEEE